MTPPSQRLRHFSMSERGPWQTYAALFVDGDLFEAFEVLHSARYPADEDDRTFRQIMTIVPHLTRKRAHTYAAAKNALMAAMRRAGSPPDILPKICLRRMNLQCHVE
jgi:hypothetical protein